MSISAKEWLVKPHSGQEPMRFFVYRCAFCIFFFLFSRAGGREWQVPLSVCSHERRSAAGPEWSHGSWATPRVVSWSAPPGSRPAGKHFASGGITYQMEPGCVLVDSQKSCRLRWELQHISCQRRQEPADCCRCRDVWPPPRRLETAGKVSRAKAEDRRRGKRRQQTRFFFPLGRK